MKNSRSYTCKLYSEEILNQIKTKGLVGKLRLSIYMSDVLYFFRFLNYFILLKLGLLSF